MLPSVVVVLFFGNSSLSIVKNSIFNGNTVDSGVLMSIDSNIYLDNCNFKENKGRYDGVIYSSSSKIYLSCSVFADDTGMRSSDIYSAMNVTKLFTYECEFNHNNTTLKSTVNNFTQIAIQEHLVRRVPLYSGIIIKETPFASSKYPMYYSVLG